MKRANELEKEAVKDVGEFMAVAARTAPKTRGIDNIEVIVIDGAAERKRLIGRMKDISKKEKRPSLERDADSISASPVIIVIGVISNPAGLDCGFCGYKNCEGLKKAKGICAYNSIDLGIAACSAAAIASQFRVDNRVMHSIGRACLDLELFSGTVKQALGIPLSISGKNPFFDRK